MFEADGTFQIVQGQAGIVGTGSTVLSSTSKRLFAGDAVLFRNAGTGLIVAGPYKVADDPSDDLNFDVDPVIAETGASGLIMWVQEDGPGRLTNTTAIQAVANRVSDFLADVKDMMVISSTGRVVNLTKTASGDTAAVSYAQGGTNLFRHGAIGDNEFSLQAFINDEWTYALKSAVSGSNPDQIVSWLFPAGTAANPGRAYLDDDDSGEFLAGDGILGWAIGGAEAMRLNTTGLGIGGAPSYKLDVIASASNAAVGRVYFSGTDGSAAEWVLQNGHTGGRQWALRAGNDDTGGGIGNGFGLYDYNSTSYVFLVDSSHNVSLLAATDASAYNTAALTLAGGLGTAGKIIGNTTIIANGHMESPAIKWTSSGTMKWQAYLSGDNLFVLDADLNAGAQMAQDASGWSAYSDRRIKDGFEEIDFIGVAQALRIGRFRNKLTGKIELAMIAQEVHAGLPELVTVGGDDEDYEFTKGDPDRLWAMQYDRVGPVALGHSRQVYQLLRERIAALEDRLATR